MEVHYTSEIHNYAQVDLSESELEIVNFIIDSDKDFKANVYKRNGTYFLFNENKKIKVVDMIGYIEYTISHPFIKVKIRKEKIEKIKKGN